MDGRQVERSEICRMFLHHQGPCCRRYIPADCLVDGEQNDSAEVLELLCSTVTTEVAKCTQSLLLEEAQTAWKQLQDQHLSASPAARLELTGQTEQAENGSNTRLAQTSCQDWLTTVLRSHKSLQTIADEADSRRMPLQGNAVGDMVCL